MPIFAGNAPLVSLNFLEEISILSQSVVFLYFSALIHKIHRRMIQKDLHDPDKHDGVITHLEPDILECKVKWALESITMSKPREVMEFQLSYFKS